MKSVLTSIRPKWCGLIASGKKTIEARKTYPKLPTPFKCYIYCTKDPKLSFWRSKTYAYADDRSHNMYDIRGNGKVIGEFVCDKVDTLFNDSGNLENYMHDILPEILKNTAMCLHEFGAYVGNRGKGKNIYGWHISDVKIYDKPRELRDFGKMRAPQSYMYVEDE
ncbi:MAG: hypothetical protein DBX93_01930 [Oscillospiraceae bacterium]|nr:MAG: hypothetical protein DBX93_01930 [Oscillospiraceae bacterium]